VAKNHVFGQSSDARAGAAPLKAGVSLLAVCALIVAAPAVAQDNAAAADEAEADAIIVTGIRQSLANSQSIKKSSDTIVDAITAEDIGALPDRSVTEALQRVPGISINRFAGSNDPDHFSVEGSGVVIRGLNFVKSEFNGRDAFAAGVGGQALNFADVPSELLGSVIISKNSTADMIEGGLAGVVNLNTRKPFDKRGLRVSLSAEANYGDFRKEWTPTISGLISNTWETDSGSFGLLVSGSYSRIKSRADGAQVSNFQTRDNQLALAANTADTFMCRNPLPADSDTMTLPGATTACGTAETAGADGFADYASVRYAPVGGQFRTQEFDRKRDGIAVSAQWESTDRNSQLTAEFIRSHSTNNWGEYVFETASDLAEYGTYPLGCIQNNRGPFPIDSAGIRPPNTDPGTRAECPVGGFQNYVYNDDNLFQSGYITNPAMGWRGNQADSPYVPIGGVPQSIIRRMVAEETTNEDWGAHFRTQLTDRLRLDIDGQYAESRKRSTDFGIWGSMFTDQELDLTGNLPVIIPHKPNVLGYTWSTPGEDLQNATDQSYFTDGRFQFWRAAMDHIEDSSGSQYALKGDLTYDFDEGSFLRQFKAGARYADREQTVRYTTYNWGMLSEVWSGSRPVNVQDVNPNDVTFYSFPDFFRGAVPGPVGGYYYNGDLAGDYQTAVGFAQGVQDRARALGANPSWNPLAERAGVRTGLPYLPADIQPVAQKDFAAYGMLSFASDNGASGLRLSGNVGLRWVSTRVRSSGVIGIGSQQSLNIADDYDTRCAEVDRPYGGPGRPGGVCNLGPDAYESLRNFVDGTSIAQEVRHSYDYLLPSLNLKLGLSDDVILRFAASKVLTRPDNAYIRNYFTAGLDTQGNLTATAGKPDLLPATAWQFDLTAEWYFARVGSLTFNLFYKDIENFFFQSVRTESFTNGSGETRDVTIRGPANYDGHGKIKGLEVAYQQTYDFLPGLLSGLGVSANYTYIDSSGLPNTFLNGGNNANNSTVPPGNLPLEQLSKHNANVAVFYERGPVSLRAAYNWRSKFLLTASDVIFPYYSIFNDATGQLDASLFVNVNSNIKVGVQGVNLLNEVTKTLQAYTGDPGKLAPRSYFMNDRRFSFIVRGTF